MHNIPNAYCPFGQFYKVIRDKSEQIKSKLSPRDLYKTIDAANLHLILQQWES